MYNPISVYNTRFHDNFLTSFNREYKSYKPNEIVIYKPLKV